MEVTIPSIFQIHLKYFVTIKSYHCIGTLHSLTAGFHCKHFHRPTQTKTSLSFQLQIKIYRHKTFNPVRLRLLGSKDFTKRWLEAIQPTISENGSIPEKPKTIADSKIHSKLFRDKDKALPASPQIL